MNNTAGRLEKETKFYENMSKKLQGLPKIFSEYQNIGLSLCRSQGF